MQTGLAGSFPAWILEAGLLSARVGPGPTPNAGPRVSGFGGVRPNVNVVRPSVTIWVSARVWPVLALVFLDLAC